MALGGNLDHAGNLKIGDVVLLFYNADKSDSREKSGFILADLSG